MIVDLTVENFRSVKHEQLFSFYVENPKSHLAGHVAHPVGEKIGLLRSAGIYGANASGKSNILMAFEALRYLVGQSGSLSEEEAIPCYEPYRLSEVTRDAPIRFEIEFVVPEGIRYSYLISYSKNRILEESLDFYPSRQKANIFKRGPDDTWETITFGGHYKGSVRRIPFFGNNSYLSKAGNSAASPELVRNVYHYFRQSVRHVGSAEEILVQDFYEDVGALEDAAMLLCAVDTGISEVKSRINKVNPDTLKPLPEDLRDFLLEKTKRTFTFGHKSEDGGVEFFRESMESDGTQRLFHAIPMLLTIFRRGGVLIWDELDRSFHPNVAELIIRLFNDETVNSRGAQLIFSTHNLQLMSPDILRRDQIWFTTKNDGQTSLYSLDNFDKNKVKSTTPYRDWYYDGRFGALPHVNYAKIASLLRPDVDVAQITSLTDDGA